MSIQKIVSYDEIELFKSGPSEIEPGEVTARDALAESVGSIGTHVISQGVGARKITQTGMLIADTADELRALIQAIEQHVGQGPADLVDIDGVVWPGCVMRSFDAGATAQIGPRFAVNYKITYLQTSHDDNG